MAGTGRCDHSVGFPACSRGVRVREAGAQGQVGAGPGQWGSRPCPWATTVADGLVLSCLPLRCLEKECEAWPSLSVHEACGWRAVVSVLEQVENPPVYYVK